MAHEEKLWTACSSWALGALKREAKRQAPTLPAISLREELQDVATAFGTKVELVEGASTETILPERKH